MTAVAARRGPTTNTLIPMSLCGVTVAVLLSSGLPRWQVMWGLALGIYAVCKWLSWQPVRTAAVSTRRRIGYFAAWPGLDAVAFVGGASSHPGLAELVFAIGKSIVGLVLLAVAQRLTSVDALTAGWIGMVGIVFSLHFGVFHVLSWIWRRLGVAAQPLMDWPILSTSVSEFWGRRWNRAFRDLTHRRIFRPLTSRFGLSAGTLLAFLFSGLVHELAITLPAGGGYGGPTLYFLIQGAGLQLERSTWGRRAGMGRGLRGWVFAMALTAVPVPLLFPRPFVVDVIVPFLEACGGAL